MPPMSAAIRCTALHCLPFAAIVVAGVASSLCASAQAPGGPGNPTGWVFQKHPPPTFYPFDDLYDWTGLDATGTITYNRLPDPLPTKGYGVYALGDGSAPFMVGGSNSSNRSSVSPGVSGTSTYQWKWVPPNNAAGQPDLTDFPAPPLYVLGRIALKPATASGANVSVTLSPSVSGSVTGTQSGNRGGLYVNLAENVFPITLAAPNPLTNPLLGDGTNQFVYDSHQPDGILVVPASANVVGASPDDMTWILPHITLPLTPAVAHILTYTLAISGSSVVVSTPGHYPDPDTGTSFPAASYIAKGLPVNNSDFGNHVVTLTVDNKPSQFANCHMEQGNRPLQFERLLQA